MTRPSTEPSFARFALVLGLLSAIGPVAIDMYLPALPTIAADLGVDIGAVQMSLVSFFVALAAGQPVYGPLSDIFGRKKPLYFGLGLFAVAAVGCAFARNVDTLVALRFVQGFGVCAALTIVRASIRDLHTGPEAARLMSLSLLVLGISPVLAPLAGSGIILILPWRSIFLIFALTGVLGIAVVFRLMPETLPAERRNAGKFSAAFADYGLLLRNGQFMSLTAITSFANAAFFAYIIGSASYFIGVYGLQPWFYSIVFALNAIGVIGLMQFTSVLMRRYGAERIVMAATVVNAAATVLLLVLTVAGLAPLAVAWPILFVSVCTFGFVAAPGSVLAIDAHGERAGTASALMGTLQFAFGAAAGALASTFFDGTATPLVAVMAVAAVAAFVIGLATLHSHRSST